MNDFERLMKGTIYDPNVKKEDDYNEDFFYIGDELAWPCRGCDKICQINCEIEEFDESYHYCGKDPSCSP